MDNTTTDEPILPDADEPAQSKQESDTTAAPEPAEPTSSNEASKEPAKEVADNSAGDDQEEFASLKEWADKKGYDLSSEEGQARAWKSLREAERRMHASTAKASQLEKTLTSAAPTDVPSTPEGTDDVVGQLYSEVNSLKRTMEIQAFLSADPKHKEMEPRMEEIVRKDPTVKALVNAGYLPIQRLYEMAVGSDPSREAQLRTEGGRQALEQVASKQQAKAFVGNATTSDFSVAKPDPFLEALENN